MISATTALGPVTYQLNALGQRVAKTVSGTTTRYHYDANGNLIGETTGTNHRDYAWLGSLPVAILEGTSQHYIYTDHLDTPRVVTNASNTIVWRWDSDPFGFFPAAEDPDGNSQLFTLNLRYPGQYFDKETNLHYNYFRDYDPQTGRYVESDPIGLEGGINTYAYTNSRPTLSIDPRGLRNVNPAEAEGYYGQGRSENQYAPYDSLPPDGPDLFTELIGLSPDIDRNCWLQCRLAKALTCQTMSAAGESYGMTAGGIVANGPGAAVGGLVGYFGTWGACQVMVDYRCDDRCDEKGGGCEQ